MYCTCTCIDVQCMYHESCATDCICLWGSWAISVTTPSVKVTTFPVHVILSLTIHVHCICGTPYIVYYVHVFG